MENKSKLKKSAIVFGIILALFLVFALAMFIIIKIIFPYVRKTEFNSVDEFVSEGGYTATNPLRSSNLFPATSSSTLPTGTIM